jgi:hypothetical protein
MAAPAAAAAHAEGVQQQGKEQVVLCRCQHMGVNMQGEVCSKHVHGHGRSAALHHASGRVYHPALDYLYARCMLVCLHCHACSNLLQTGHGAAGCALC